MKLLFASITLAICFSNCSAETDETTSVELIPAYLSQPLQGKIDGVNWTFGSGRLIEPLENSSDPSQWAFTMVSEDIEDICGEFIISTTDKLSVNFTAVPQKERTDLGFTLDSQTLILVNGSVTPTQNNILTDGWIEFTSIDAATVAGKIVAASDTDNVINGDFELTKCCRSKTNSFAYEVCE